MSMGTTGITCQRPAEQVGQQAAAPPRRQDTAGELAALLAHELNQPLAAIASFAESSRLLLQRSPGNVTAIDGNLVRIADLALRAGDLVRQLRRIVGRTCPAERLDLNNLLRVGRDEVAAVAAARGIHLDLDPDPHLPSAWGSGAEIRDVLGTLLRHALDASPDASRITVTTRCGDGRAQVAVRDGGAAGALADNLADMPDLAGGIALRVGRLLLERQGGRLWCEATSAGGVVGFELPLAP